MIGIITIAKAFGLGVVLKTDLDIDWMKPLVLRAVPYNKILNECDEREMLNPSTSLDSSNRDK